MAVNSKVEVFTTAMRAEFVNSYNGITDPAPWEKYTEKVPSTARIEHYPWMSPTPGIQKYAGHRRFGKIDVVKYAVENEEFDASFEVLLRDIEDDQTGGYMKKPQELAGRAKAFPGRWVLKHLAAGGSRKCFDGTNFFADSHTIGTGDNNLTKNCASNDGAALKLVAMYTGGPLKPLLWQDRKPPRFETDAGTEESLKSKKVDYWIDFEGQAAFGYWWDAILVTITDTPNLLEMHEMFSDIEKQFRTFKYPKAISGDEDEFVHEQVQFSPSNLTLVGSTALAHLLRQSLTLNQLAYKPVSGDTSATGVDNLFKGFADWQVTSYL